MIKHEQRKQVQQTSASALLRVTKIGSHLSYSRRNPQATGLAQGAHEVKLLDGHLSRKGTHESVRVRRLVESVWGTGKQGVLVVGLFAIAMDDRHPC